MKKPFKEIQLHFAWRTILSGGRDAKCYQCSTAEVLIMLRKETGLSLLSTKLNKLLGISIIGINLTAQKVGELYDAGSAPFFFASSEMHVKVIFSSPLP